MVDGKPTATGGGRSFRITGATVAAGSLTAGSCSEVPGKNSATDGRWRGATSRRDAAVTRRPNVVTVSTRFSGPDRESIPEETQGTGRVAGQVSAEPDDETDCAQNQDRRPGDDPPYVAIDPSGLLAEPLLHVRPEMRYLCPYVLDGSHDPVIDIRIHDLFPVCLPPPWRRGFLILPRCIG